MKKILVLLPIIFSFYLPLHAETLKLSLEECISIAEKKSLQALFAQIETEKLDLDDAANWRLILPELGYRLENIKTEKNYIYHGTGDPQDFWNSNSSYRPPIGPPGEYREYIYENDTTKSNYLKHEIYLTQRLFDSNWLKTFEDIKSNAVRKEILTMLFKGKIHYDVRIAYYNFLINEELISQGIDYQQLLLSAIPKDNLLGELMNIELQTTILAYKKNMIDLSSNMEYNKQILLKTMRKPLDTQLELTTPLEYPKLDMQEAREMALENNLVLKNLTIEKMVEEAKISKEALSYLPRLDFSLSTPLIDKLSGKVTAQFDPDGYSSPFFVDLGVSYLLDNKYLEYESLNGETMADWEYPNNSLWTIEPKTNYSIKLSLSLSDILRADTNVKKHKVEIKSVDVLMEEKIARILLDLEKFKRNIENNQQEIELEKQELELLIKKKALLEQAVPSDNSQLILDYYVNCLWEIRSLTTSRKTISALYHSFAEMQGYTDGIETNVTTSEFNWPERFQYNDFYNDGNEIRSYDWWYQF